MSTAPHAHPHQQRHPSAAASSRLPLTPVRSSHLRAAGYDPSTHTLDIAFKSGGPTYRYHGVPPSVHDAFLASASKGKFFGSSIRARFRHSTLPK